MNTLRDAAKAVLDDSHRFGYVTPETLNRLEKAVADAEGMGWQPIETAPKDGTSIIVCGAGGKVWCNVMWEERPRAGKRWTSFIGALPFAPTHWMQIPKAPKVKP